MMTNLIHPNIVHLFGLIQQGLLLKVANYLKYMYVYLDYIDEPWIVLEYLPHGDLKSFLIVILFKEIN